MAETRAQSNRRIRQDALREWLSEKCTVQHFVDNLKKIEELDPKSESFTNELNKYKTANDQRLKVMSKYLPDLKQTELVGDGGEDIRIQTVERVIVRPEKKDS